MTLPLRALRAFAPLLLLAPLPLAAQQAALPPATSTALPAPRYAQPDDPWIYRGTDIPIDKEWLFGEMPNGVRYAVRRNSAPPGSRSSGSSSSDSSARRAAASASSAGSSQE